MPDRLLRASEILAQIGCSEAGLRARIRSGEVEAYRIGSQRRFAFAPRSEPDAQPPAAQLPAPPVRRLSRWEECVADAVAWSDHLNEVPLNGSSPLVYVLQAGDDGPIKIGRTSDLGRLRDRLGSIQTGAHQPIYVLRLLQGGAGLEAALHARYRAARIRGEWFQPTPAIRRLARRPGLDHLPTAAAS